MTSNWYEVGYADGYAGKEERPPEQYNARNVYRRGWSNGRVDGAMKAPFNPIDPDLAR